MIKVDQDLGKCFIMSKQEDMNLIHNSPKEYFRRLIQDGMEKRGIEAEFVVKEYLAFLLEYYVDVRNLFVEKEGTNKKSLQTLAEMFLKANNTSNRFLRKNMLKKTAETSLYISGFFGESLSRKTVDIDYYIHMGSSAYAILADNIKESEISDVYVECAERFLSFMEVLSYISDRSFINSNENILNIYECYLRTGSDLAYEKLIEKGILVSSYKSHQHKN